MKPIQNQTQLFVLSLIYLLFAASISTVDSRDTQPSAPPESEPQQNQAAPQAQEAPANVDPKVKEICSAAKDPQLCEKTYATVNGNEGGKSMSPVAVLSAQLTYATKSGLVSAWMAAEQAKKGKDTETKIAYNICSDEFVLATAKIIEATPFIFQDNFAASKDKLGTVCPHLTKCEEASKDLDPPLFEQVICDLRAVIDNCYTLAAAGSKGGASAAPAGGGAAPKADDSAAAGAPAGGGSAPKADDSAAPPKA